jgi:hypothetical protein
MYTGVSGNLFLTTNFVMHVTVLLEQIYIGCCDVYNKTVYNHFLLFIYMNTTCFDS